MSSVVPTAGGIVTLGPVARVASTATSLPYSISSASAQMTYYVGVTLINSATFNFVDGFHQVYVPITVSWAGDAEGNATAPGGSGTSSSAIEIDATDDNGTYQQVLVQKSCTNGVGCGAYQGQKTFNFDALAYQAGVFDGSPYHFLYPQEIKVFLNSGAVAYSGAASAFADPHFTIDDPNSPFQISLENGVGNAAPAAAPEPSTWLMLLGGFAAVAASLRRRRGRLAVRPA